MRLAISSDFNKDDLDKERQIIEQRLLAVKRQLKTAAKNMTLAESEEERKAMAEVFNELKREEAQLENQCTKKQSTVSNADPDAQFDVAMSQLNRITTLLESPEVNYDAMTELFRHVNIQLHLRFREIEKGKRIFSQSNGGVITIGAVNPPAKQYVGPTDRAYIRAMLSKNKDFFLPDAGLNAPKSSLKDGCSANVQRVTRRCTCPAGHVGFPRFVAHWSPTDR